MRIRPFVAICNVASNPTRVLIATFGMEASRNTRVNGVEKAGPGKVGLVAKDRARARARARVECGHGTTVVGTDLEATPEDIIHFWMQAEGTALTSLQMEFNLAPCVTRVALGSSSSGQNPNGLVQEASGNSTRSLVFSALYDQNVAQTFDLHFHRLTSLPSSKIKTLVEAIGSDMFIPEYVRGKTAFAQSDSRGPWGSPMVARKNLILAFALVAIFGLSLNFLYQQPASQSLLQQTGKAALSPFGKRDNLVDIHNATLGFEKVYAISLPERSDKRDTVLLQAQLTNFTLEIVDGVLGSEVSKKALPHTFKQSNGTTGCWRAHLNVLDKMIQDDVQTALILEDDADWDIGLKAQMTEFARGSRWLLGTGDSNPASPYGDGWDILWIGHCHTEPNKTDNRRWVIDHDPTVPPDGSRWAFGQPNMTRWEKGENPDPQTRLVYIQQYGWCTSGYAVTLRGAKRILWRTSMMPFNWSIDGGMGYLCAGESFKDFTCVAPFPRLIGKSTAAGSNARGSDINGAGDKEFFSEKSKSENVMFSVRQNVEAILNHETTFKSYFKNPSGDQLTLEQITAARGHPEYVDY